MGRVKKAMKEIRKEVADTIILSHWDMDHILGVTNMHDDNYNQVWIVPCINDITSIGVNARRLCHLFLQ